VTFFNENFKRDNEGLLAKIQRSTRGGKDSTVQEQQRHIESLTEQVEELKFKVHTLETQFASMSSLAELEGRFSTLAQQLNSHFERNRSYRTENEHSNSNDLDEVDRIFSATSLEPSKDDHNYNPIPLHSANDSNNYNPLPVNSSNDSNNYNPIPVNSANDSNNYDPLPVSSVKDPNLRNVATKATLPPHPKMQNIIPSSHVPPPPQHIPSRKSQVSTGSFLRSLSNESTFSSLGLDPFEKNFFTTLILDENSTDVVGSNNNVNNVDV